MYKNYLEENTPNITDITSGEGIEEGWGIAKGDLNYPSPQGASQDGGET